MDHFLSPAFQNRVWQTACVNHILLFFFSKTIRRNSANTRWRQARRVWEEKGKNVHVSSLWAVHLESAWWWISHAWFLARGMSARWVDKHERWTSCVGVYRWCLQCLETGGLFLPLFSRSVVSDSLRPHGLHTHRICRMQLDRSWEAGRISGRVSQGKREGKELFSWSVMSDSLQPHGPQHARPPCPSPSPRACSNSCPSCGWCHPTISSSVVPFSSCLQSFPASGSFPVSQVFASRGQSVEASASALVLPMNIQDWFPLGWTGWISLQSKGLSRVFSSTTVWKHQFLGAQPSWWSNSHIHMWSLKKKMP